MKYTAEIYLNKKHFGFLSNDIEDMEVFLSKYLDRNAVKNSIQILEKLALEKPPGFANVIHFLVSTDINFFIKSAK